MKSWSQTAWHLWAVLANGQRQHVRDLAQTVGVEINALNVHWKQLPPEVQKQLRQQDGWWQLKQAMAVLSPQQTQTMSAATGFAVEVVSEVGSTNDELWARWQQGEDIHRQALVALQQSHGRGRMQRTWHNVLGQTLMFSIGWQMQSSRHVLAPLPLVVGLVVQQVLAEHGVQAQLKWPNDLVVGQQKLGGILVESKQRGERWHVVAGIGINVMPPKHEDLSNSATACVNQNSVFNSHGFLSALLPRLDSALQRFFDGGFELFQDAYQQQMRDVGHSVCLYERGELIGQGQVAGVNAIGALRVVYGNGSEQVYMNGEISMRPEGVALPADHEHQPVSPAEQAMATDKRPVNAAPPPAQPRYILLDGGNSQLKWAWVGEDKTLHFGGRAPYTNLQAFADFMQQQAGEIPIVGCAVCGAKKMFLVEQAAGRDVRWLPSMRHALGVTNHYYKVQQHGSDRWFNVLGSRLFSQNSCVVVSCGTAITVDAITHDNHYLGGSIMPGFNLMKEAMAAKTANLNQPIGKPYPFATSTPNALASGMHDAACGAVILMQYRLQQRQQDLPVDIILTGGGASKIEQHLPKALILDSQVKIVDNLVLFGLQNWVEHTCNY